MVRNNGRWKKKKRKKRKSVCIKIIWNLKGNTITNWS